MGTGSEASLATPRSIPPHALLRRHPDTSQMPPRSPLLATRDGCASSSVQQQRPSTAKSLGRGVRAGHGHPSTAPHNRLSARCGSHRQVTKRAQNWEQVKEKKGSISRRVVSTLGQQLPPPHCIFVGIWIPQKGGRQQAAAREEMSQVQIHCLYLQKVHTGSARARKRRMSSVLPAPRCFYHFQSSQQQAYGCNGPVQTQPWRRGRLAPPGAQSHQADPKQRRQKGKFVLFAPSLSDVGILDPQTSLCLEAEVSKLKPTKWPPQKPFLEFGNLYSGYAKNIRRPEAGQDKPCVAGRPRASHPGSGICAQLLLSDLSAPLPSALVPFRLLCAPPSFPISFLLVSRPTDQSEEP